jgi:hypothetical protein
MVYKILKTGRGVIQSRREVAEKEEVEFLFENAPKYGTAIFTLQNGASYYRELEDGRCVMKKSALNGCVEVTVAILRDKTPIDRWECEGFCVHKQPDGSVVILPNDDDIPARFAELEISLDEEIRKREALETRLLQLEKDFKKIKQGYNLI